MANRLEFLPDSHPANRVVAPLLARMREAQTNTIARTYRSAADLIAQALDEVKLAAKPLPEHHSQPCTSVTSLSASALTALASDTLRKAGLPESAILTQAVTVAQRIDLLRVFAQPDATLERIEAKIAAKVDKFPRTAADIEVGSNPGDVLDPYIVAAAQTLLYRGRFEDAIAGIVAHKALMMIEDMLGHLHEDVIGEMRGNVRVPEPRGVDQEKLDLLANPFPGADVCQPPSRKGELFRFHQIKSKTGSAKGGDGKRLGLQLARLQEVYGGEIFYDALIGNTLRGHRSKAGVEKAAPTVTVLVGRAAFSALTGTAVGAQLLLRTYQTAFGLVAVRNGYSVAALAKGIVATFMEKAKSKGAEDSMNALLVDVTDAADDELDSRLFNAYRKAGTFGRLVREPRRHK